MGSIIDDRDFHAILLGSLPESYRPILSSISAAARITQTPLSSNELITPKRVVIRRLWPSLFQL